MGGGGGSPRITAPARGWCGMRVCIEGPERLNSLEAIIDNWKE